MNHATDRRSIVTSLVWGILAMCVIGSPGDAYGQTDETSLSPIVEVGSWVPVRDVEELDTSTRLIWTLQMIFAPGALAHVSPLYAYDPRELEGRMVYPDRIGRVATVSTCNATTMEPTEPTLLANGNLFIPRTGDRTWSATDYRFSGPSEPTLLANGNLSLPGTGDRLPWCANYGSDTADTAHATFELLSSNPPDGEGQWRPVYFATTYPLPDIEPEKRFVVEGSR